MMSCRNAARLLSERLERPLGRRRVWALRLHVLICTACRRYGVQIHWLHERLRGEARAESAAPLDRAARERVVERVLRAQRDGERAV